MDLVESFPNFNMVQLTWGFIKVEVLTQGDMRFFLSNRLPGGAHETGPRDTL